MARFTIGIPTYNRAGFLPRAIESALDQSHDDVEVLVIDNASTDHTPEVVRPYEHRIRYIRSETNIGSWPNFARLAEQAEGEFFSWLQDDDLVHRDFARRAAQALGQADDITVYTAFQYITPSATNITWPTASVYGPPIALDWMRGGLRIVDGLVPTIVSFFASFANPPSVAFRTAAVRQAITQILDDCDLLNERIAVSHAAIQGRVAVEPWAGAIFFQHDAQNCYQMMKRDRSVFRRHWLALAQVLAPILESRSGDWRQAADACFREISTPYKIAWLESAHDPSDWESISPIIAEVRQLLIESLPTTNRPVEVDLPLTRPHRFKEIARSFVPPIAWNALKATRRSSTITP